MHPWVYHNLLMETGHPETQCIRECTTIFWWKQAIMKHTLNLWVYHNLLLETGHPEHNISMSVSQSSAGNRPSWNTQWICECTTILWRKQAILKHTINLWVYHYLLLETGHPETRNESVSVPQSSAGNRPSWNTMSPWVYHNLLMETGHPETRNESASVPQSSDGNRPSWNTQWIRECTTIFWWKQATWNTQWICECTTIFWWKQAILKHNKSVSVTQLSAGNRPSWNTQ